MKCALSELDSSLDSSALRAICQGRDEGGGLAASFLYCHQFSAVLVWGQREIQREIEKWLTVVFFSVGGVIFWFGGSDRVGWLVDCG